MTRKGKGFSVTRKRAIYTTKAVDRKYQYAPAVLCVRAGLIFVSGMVGWDSDGRVPPTLDAAGQARLAFENLRDVLHEAGASLDDVVSETEYVVDMNTYPQIARVRRKYFPINRPAATLVEVRKLFKPELLFEIQAIAVAGR